MSRLRNTLSRFALLSGLAPQPGATAPDDEDKPKTASGSGVDPAAGGKTKKAKDKDKDKDDEGSEDDGDDNDGEDDDDDDTDAKAAIAAGAAAATVAAIRRSAFRAGRALERERCALIFASTAAPGRVASAAQLAFTTGMSSASAIGLLDTMPKEAAANGFVAAMAAQEQPSRGLAQDPGAGADGKMHPVVAAMLELGAKHGVLQKA